MLRYALLFLLTVPAFAEGERHYQNLEVLPETISRDALGEVMLENLLGLGLPRLAGEGCLYCHVGDLEKPRSDWDWASDAKPMKVKARSMMAMVRSINEQYLDELDGRVAPDLRVTCATCHAGRTDPRPLPDVLWATWESDGIDSAIERYETLRERFYAGDAYDFRPNVLPALAIAITDEGAIDDGIALAALNAELHPDDVAAGQSLVRLQLEKALNANGVDAALDRLETVDAALKSPGLLDALAWRLKRSDRAQAGNELIEANRELYPDSYRTLESHVFVLSESKPKKAMKLLESWLKKQPDHDRARRLLTNLRARAERQN